MGSGIILEKGETLLYKRFDGLIDGEIKKAGRTKMWQELCIEVEV